jgi:hypothetical protein
MMNAFEKLLVNLNQADVEFILVEGLAVALCGYVRATEDVDILIHADRANVERLLECLQGFGEGAASELDPEDFALEEGAMRVIEEFPLYIFTQMSGYTFRDLLSFTEPHTIEDATIRHLSIDGLLMLKSDSQRPKDQLDVHALKAIQREEDSE